MRSAEKDVQAIIISGVVVIVVVIIGLAIIISNRNKSSDQQDQGLSILQDDGGAISEDAVAIIGQNYVKDLASYDQGQGPPILLHSTEFISEGLWLATYEVQQHISGYDQIYTYMLEIRDGHVIRPTISVEDISKSLEVSMPEPEQIITKGDLLVKGRIVDAEKQVFLRLLDENLVEILALGSIDVDKENGHIYSTKIKIPTGVKGKLIIEATSDQHTVLVPFIFVSEGN